MSATDPVTPESRRFSIRLPPPLWIGLAAVGVIVVAVVLRIGMPIYRQQVAIRKIEGAGGNVTTRPKGPDWFNQWCNDQRIHVCDAVVDIEFHGSRAAITDVQLAELDGPIRDVGHFTLLRFHGVPLTDAGLTHLTSLTNLKTLGLHGTQVTDAGLELLLALKNLETLRLDYTHVTDTGLLRLKGLKSLKKLSIKGIIASDEGLYELKRALPGVQIET